MVPKLRTQDKSAVFRHAELEYGLYFVPTLLLDRFLSTDETNDFFCQFHVKKDKFLGKTRQSDFQEYTPLPGGQCPVSNALNAYL